MNKCSTTSSLRNISSKCWISFFVHVLIHSSLSMYSMSAWVHTHVYFLCIVSKTISFYECARASLRYGVGCATKCILTVHLSRSVLTPYLCTAMFIIPCQHCVKQGKISSSTHVTCETVSYCSGNGKPVNKFLFSTVNKPACRVRSVSIHGETLNVTARRVNQHSEL